MPPISGMRFTLHIACDCMARYYNASKAENGVFHCQPPKRAMCYLHVCRVTEALRRESSVYTLMELLNAVRGSYVSRNGFQPICEELTQVHNWHDHFKVPSAEDGDGPMCRELIDIQANHQFKICKNTKDEVVVFSKQFANSKTWEAVDGRGGEQVSTGIPVLLKVPT